MNDADFVPLEGYERLSEAEVLRRAREFRERAMKRRTVREFSDRPVPREVIEECLRAAGTAPSGANLQPWRFVVVADPETKRKIRLAAEEEEREFYENRAPRAWLDALAPLGTNAEKPFLETAPFLVAVFAERYGIGADGNRVKHYYADESVGLATGTLIQAIHHAGLASLTHTPSPMGFLCEILGRPENEKPFLLLVVGHPADGATVPGIGRKPLEEIATFFEPRASQA